MSEPNDPTEAVKASVKQQKARDELRKNKEEQETLEELIETRKRYNEILSRELEIQYESIKVGEDLGKAQKRLAQELINQQTDLVAANQELKLAQSEGRQEDEAIAQQMVDNSERNIAQLQKQIKNLNDLSEARKNSTKVNDDAAKAAKKLGVEVDKLGDALEESKKKGDLLSDFFEDAFGDAPGIIGDVYRQAGRLKGAVGELGEKLAENAESMGVFKGLVGNLGTLFQTIGSMSIGQIFPFVAIGLFIGKLASLASEVDGLSKDIGKATGFGNKFSNELMTMAQQGNLSGIGFKESADALKALTTGLSSFNSDAEETNIYLGMTIAKLEKLGVSSSDTVKSIDHLQRTMGLMAEQAADITAQIARMGNEISVSGTKMLNDFNAASARLSIYGERNIEVFKGLAAMAKASGIEISNLVSISEKFDKFDSAADSIAQLNAVLGTQLSTMEMLAADDDERIMMIKQQVQASVGNFDSLDKHTKMYIAQAMGVNSVSDAQRILNMSMAEFQSMEEGQREQVRIQEELAEATQEVVKFGEMLSLVMYELFLSLRPVIDAFVYMIQLLTSAIPLFTNFAIGLGIITAGLILLSTWFVISAIGAGTFWTALLWPALKFIGIAMLIMAGIYAIGEAISWMMGGATPLLDFFVDMFNLFKKKINPPFVRIFHFLAEGIKIMMNPLKFVTNAVSSLTSKFASFFGIAKDGAADVVNNDGFNLQAIANINTDNVAAGINKVKSALVELSNIEVSGLVAMTTDGTNTSLIMGSVATEMAMLLGGGKLSVDVSIPEIKTPDVHVKVYIGDTELRNIIRTEVSTMVGGAG